MIGAKQLRKPTYDAVGRALNRVSDQRWLRVWLKSALATTPSHGDLWGDREQLIRRLAPGKSFLDLGGMFDISGRVGFLAEEAGAERVVLFDVLDPSEQFQSEHARRDSAVRYVQGDLHDPVGIRELGTFDVVWCAGVIYHTPDPWGQLKHLRPLTGETLMLGTHVIPEVPGVPQACLFYPELSDEQRQPFIEVHGEQAKNFWAIGQPFDYTPNDGYANFWWGISRSALAAMLKVAAFEAEE